MSNTHLAYECVPIDNDNDNNTLTKDSQEIKRESDRDR